MSDYESLKSGPFPMDSEEIERIWSKFPEMSKEELIAYLEVYKIHSDFDNMYKHENNEAP